MKTTTFFRYCLPAFAAVAVFSSGGVAADDINSAQAKCRTGMAVKLGQIRSGPPSLPTRFGNSKQGVLPIKIDGVTTVSSREAKCLIDTLGENLLVWGAMSDKEGLPNSHNSTFAANNKEDDATNKAITKRIDYYFANDKEKPILVYCHHEACALSYNTAIRLVDAGFKNIYWLREGMRGWQSAGYPIVPLGGNSPGQ